MGRAEEERAVEAEGHDAVVEQAPLLVVVIGVVEGNAFDLSRTRDRSQRDDAGERETHDDRRDEVDRDGHDEGEDEDDRVAAGRAHDAAHRPHLHHLHRRGQQHAAECGERDDPDERSGDEHEHEQHDRVRERGEAGTGARLDVDGRARDRRRRRDPAEERDDEVRDALPEELPIGVVLLADAHRVGDGRAQQALEGGEGGDGDGGGNEGGERIRIEEAGRRRRDPARQLAHEPETRGQEPGDRRGRRDRHEGERERRPPAGPEQDDRGDAERDDHGDRIGTLGEPRDRVDRELSDALLAAGLDAEDVGELLEGDDDRDARGEALDEGGRKVPHVAPDSRQREGEEDDTGHDADLKDSGRAEPVDDGDEHNRHGTGGAGHLEVAPAEDRREGARDDRGRETGFRTEPRGHAEGEGEGQGDDRDGEPREEISSRRSPHGAEVGTARQQPDQESTPRGYPPSHLREPAVAPVAVDPSSSSEARSVWESWRLARRSCRATASSWEIRGSRTE